MDTLWTLPELVSEVEKRITALPPPRNGQVRAIPDDRTIRYYVTLGLLDRPSVMRGRTALYGARHVAQVVAIKRLQTMGRSLSEIQELWPTLDDRTLERMSGVQLEGKPRAAGRPGFWKREPAPIGNDAARANTAAGEATTGDVAIAASAAEGRARLAPTAVELRIELAPGVVLSLSVADQSVAISPADVRAISAAAAPLLAELASRRLAPHPGGEPS